MRLAFPQRLASVHLLASLLITAVSALADRSQDRATPPPRLALPYTPANGLSQDLDDFEPDDWATQQWLSSSVMTPCLSHTTAHLDRCLP